MPTASVSAFLAFGEKVLCIHKAFSAKITVNMKWGLFFMDKNLKKIRKCCCVFCTGLLMGSLLLSGCTTQPDPQGQTQPAETSGPVQDTQADKTQPTVDAPADPSVTMLRQAMVETPQIFAAAFFGYVPQESAQKAELFPVMRKAAPQLCEDMPFLLTVGEENIVGTFGYLFCIVPADEQATVAINRRTWNKETQAYEQPQVLYRCETGTPVLVMCPNDDQIPDTEVIITDTNGNVAVWYPHMDNSYRVAALYDDNAQSLLFDFTSYDELPDPVGEQEIDSAQLVGTWDLAWTEVEGDRNEAAPGRCTIEIKPDEKGFFRFTYTDREFPEDNVRDRELIVTPGELYPGCDNDQWIGKVSAASEDTVQYTLTLLKDGTLLVQSGFDFDGQPMVSHSWFVRGQ